MKKILTIIIESKSREFDSRMMIAHEAIKRGYQVIIGSQGQIFKLLKYLPKCIVFDKCISTFKHEILKKIRRFGHKIVSLDEEGICSDNRKWLYLKHRISGENLELIEYFFTWGVNESKLIDSHYPQYKHKIKTSGNPRIDTWKSDNEGLYKHETNHIKKKYKDYILINSNFGIFHAIGNDFLKNQAFDTNIIETKDEEEKFDADIEFNKKVFLSFVEMIKFLATSVPDQTILIRPHPSESIERWKEKFKEYNNVFIEYKFSVTPWIIASKCMIHSSCTTGIEGFLINRPTISYLPYKDNNFVNFVSNKLSDISQNPKQVLEKINSILNQDYNLSEDRKEKIKKVKNILQNIDNTSATNIILNNIDKIELPVQKKLNDLIFKFAHLENILRKNIKNIISFKKNQKSFEQQKMPGLSIDEVNSKMKYFEDKNEQLQKLTFKVKKISENLFHIY